MKRYSDAQNAILILQSWARMHITREKFIIMRTLTLAVIKLQSYARMMITRKKFEETIQSQPQEAWKDLQRQFKHSEAKRREAGF
jgi:hypothetical protein